MKRNYLLPFLLLTVINANSQEVQVPPDPGRWDTIKMDKEDTAKISVTREIYLGKECLVLTGGMLILRDVEVRDGSVEADISFPAGRSFPGFAVRMQDLNNFESFYLRPHQSGNPDATQYTPEFNGLTGFQLYYGLGYDGAYSFRFDQWHHIKIELDGLRGSLYIDDSCVIKGTELLTGWKTGMIGIGAGGGLLRIANVRYTRTQRTEPAPIPVPANGAGGIITEWQVSNAVSRTLFEKQYRITPGLRKKLVWSGQKSDSSGILNLAKLATRSDSTNTIVTRLIVNSSFQQIKEFTFGFSDFVTVYLNDEAIYYGADKQYSRDYRFLGTIGFFDRLFLPLKKGDNELLLVVSEDFGGWGVEARFENMDNIIMK